MRYTELIGRTDDYVEHRSITPKYYPCLQCNKKGKRKQVIRRRIAHVGPVHRRAWIEAEVGLYRARCSCCKYFQATIPGVPYKGRYSYEVRNQVANSLIRDRLPYRLVQARMREDYRLELSLGYIHECFLWAHQQINMETYWQFVLSNFSGVLCLDEVHEGSRTMLFATDPLADFTVSFQLVETNDQAHMDAFLQRLKDRGLVVEVAITDGSPLYKDSLQQVWQELDHQLCLFHVIKEVNTLILDGVRAIKNRLKRQGNKGRKRRVGRPSHTVQQQRHSRQEMSKKAQATFIWDHQYLIVRKQENLSDQDQDDLALMYAIAPELAPFRRFNQEFYRLFEKGITPQQARYRRTRLLHQAAYQANPFLKKALNKLRRETFEHMIVFLKEPQIEPTNNHVERNNRAFRMLQKTRYKRRKCHTIEKALDLFLYARMLDHPLYQSREVSSLRQEEVNPKMAA